MVFVNGCKTHALGKFLGLQEIRAGLKHMIQSLTNEEAGSERGKANCLKGQAWRLSTRTLSVSPPTTSRPGFTQPKAL